MNRERGHERKRFRLYFPNNKTGEVYPILDKDIEDFVEDLKRCYPNRLPIAFYQSTISMWCDNYELGSYGIRECSFLHWIYGTGCAEPRLSNCLKMIDKEIN